MEDCGVAWAVPRDIRGRAAARTTYARTYVRDTLSGGTSFRKRTNRGARFLLFLSSPPPPCMDGEVTRGRWMICVAFCNPSHRNHVSERGACHYTWFLSPLKWFGRRLRCYYGPIKQASLFRGLGGDTSTVQQRSWT